MFTSIDWAGMFSDDVAVLEIIIRGTLMYWAIFFLLRVLLRRESAGNIGITDVLVIVLLADAAQNGMAGEYSSVTNGITLVATIIAWSYLFQWLSYHWTFFQKLTTPPKLLIYSNGKIHHRNLRKELITMQELRGEMRKEGCESLSEVDKMYMESDGAITIIQKKKD